MKVAKGILTAFGGASSHAALVSRQMGKTCVCGCSALDIDYEKGTVTVGETVLKEGDWISIDGFSGEVYNGKIDTSPSEVMDVLTGNKKPEEAEMYGRYAQLMEWADEFRTLNVRANTESHDAEVSVALGAEGVGLCRTEHMFFDHLRRNPRDDLLVDEGRPREGARQAARHSSGRTSSICSRRWATGRSRSACSTRRCMSSFRSITWRTIRSSPRHWPRRSASPWTKFIAASKNCRKSNPMLGHRGCRLGIVYPEITAMQARAILEAACAVKKAGIDVHPEIMIPLAGYKTEFDNQEKVIRDTAARSSKSRA